VITEKRGAIDERAKFLTVIMLALYLYCIPILCYEDPRFTDPYLHLARAVFVAQHGSYSYLDVRYLSEFPTAFVYFAIALIVANVPALVFMNFLPLFVVIVLSLCIYALAKVCGLANPVVASLFMVSINPFPIFHASPQAFALIAYALFFVIFVRAKSLRISRKFTVLLLLFFVTIVASNPTTSVFTMTAVVVSAVVISVMSRSSAEWREWQWPGFVLLLIVGIPLTWFSLAAPGTFQGLVIRGVQTYEEWGVPDTLSLPDSAHSDVTYLKTVTLNESIVLVCWVLALVSFLVIFSNKSRRTGHNPLLVTWLASTFLFLSLALRLEATFIMRSFVYGLFPLSVGAAMIMEVKSTQVSRRSVKLLLHGLKVLALIVLISGPSLLTVSRYAVDSFHYIPASGLYAADFTAAQSRGKVLLFSQQGWEFRFYKALQGGSPDMQVSTLGSTYQSAVEFSDGRFGFRRDLAYLRSFDWVIFPDYVFNAYLLREGSTELVELQVGMEQEVARRNNLVLADTSVRIYAKP
jgi:hypothetical protein